MGEALRLVTIINDNDLNQLRRVATVHQLFIKIIRGVSVLVRDTGYEDIIAINNIENQIRKTINIDSAGVFTNLFPGHWCLANIMGRG